MENVHRETVQKKEILDFLRNTTIHPTPEQVYEHVKKRLPMISLATVYRNLNQMAEEGIIGRINTDREMRFDGNEIEHQHFVCEKCNKIIDIEFHNTKRLLRELEGEGHEVRKVEVIFRGMCKECSNKLKGGKNGKNK